MDREPFEWWYTEDATGKYRSFRDPVADPGAEGLTLVSGPRWRLTAPKYGQDLPGVDIGIDALNGDPGCLEPPIPSGSIKYVRGEVVTTTINLLDWKGVSPLATSLGWVDASQNENAVVKDPVTGEPADPEPTDCYLDTADCLSVNGAPLSADFDLVFYVKGDIKPTVVYRAELYIEWDDLLVAP